MLSARTWLLLPTLTLTTLAILAACSSGDDKSTTTPTTSAVNPTSVAEFDVCSLLTAREASAATGEAVADGSDNSDSTSFFCEWTGDRSNVSLEVVTGTAQERETFFEQHNVGAPIDGLGNRAQFTTVSGVDVLTDEYYVGVTVLSLGFTEDQRKQQSRSLAELVLTRLPGTPPAMPSAGPAAATLSLRGLVR